MSNVTGRFSWAVVLALALTGVAAPFVPGASGHAHPATGFRVLAIDQTPGKILEQSNITVAVQVSDPSSVNQSYFTFCQLTRALCYLPVAMTLTNSSWFVGTTHAMTNYDGMKVGVRAGINITIVFKDGSNLTEPSLPNSFSSLTVTQSITGENMYEIQVQNHSYSLSGVVTDQVTGAGVAGAHVSLVPGNGTAVITGSTGGYTFTDLSNGSYQVSVAQPGYTTRNASVSIQGQDLVQNLGLVNSSASKTTPPSTQASPSFLSTTTGRLELAGVALVAGAAAVGLIFYRRRSAAP